MPLLTETQTGPIRHLPETDLAPKLDPSIGEVTAAAFRQENSLVSLATNETSFQDYQSEPGYDPFDGGDIQGYEMFAENFIESKSTEHSAAIKQQIDKELEDKQTLAAGGIPGFVAMVAAGATDPLFWVIPGAAPIKGAKTVGGAALRVAAIGGVSEIPVEAAKQFTQEARTTEDALMAVGGAAVLSGILGGAMKGLSKQEIKSISKKLDEVMGPADTPIVAGNTKSMGAAETVSLTKEELEPVAILGTKKLTSKLPEAIRGKVEAVTQAGMNVSPQLRTENSPSVRARQLTNEMMESATVKQANVNGKATAPEGGTAETRIKLWDAKLFVALRDADDLYTKYRQGMGATSRIINDYVMRNRAGKLTKSEFNILAGKTARRGDKSDIPEVQALAESYRKNVFDPMKDEAISLGLLHKDIDVKTATSYLTRVYNTQKIAARRPEWNAIVESWLTSGKKTAALADKPTAQQKLEAAMTETEIKAIAEDLTNNIMGISAGRVPYQVVSNVRGPLKERTFNIPDRLIEDFLESDIDIIGRQYIRTMAPDIELSRLYGDANMEQQITEIADSYKELIDAAKTEKERTQLTNRLKDDQRDIKAMRDRLRGTYRTPENPNEFFIRAGRTLRDVNFMRMLGGMTLSAIPDMARPISVNGLMPVAKGLMNLATNPKRFGMSVKEARKAAVGLDMVMNSRVASLAEITDIYNKGSKFERGLRSASDTFSKMTLMSQWNTALKSFSGVVTQDRILLAAVDVAAGKASKSTIKRLAASGIGKEQAEAIAAQFKKFGDEGSLALSNGHLWENKTALETFRAAVLKDVDRTIVTPGQGEKPLWTSGETGKMVFQFKTFAAAAHHKILISDLQYRDAAALNGFLMSVAFGTAAYGAKQLVAGREISTDPKKLIVESLDRSGAFGYMWDVNNMMEKFSRGEVGVSKLIGAPPMSRYAARNISGAILGPSIGTAEDIFAIGGAAFSGEFTDAERRKAIQMIPGQNLFYMRGLLEVLED